jgi:hypothetical protein
LDELPVEGFVPVAEIPFPAEFQEGRFRRLRGRRGGDIRPGDPVDVQLIRVDLRNRWLDMALKPGSRIRQSRPRGGRRKERGAGRRQGRKKPRGAGRKRR